jgi:predicted MFS family arabinose efflux permease
MALAAIAMGPLLGPALVLPLLQQPMWTGVGFGVTATLAGLIKVPGNVTATVGSLLGGALSRRINVRSIMITAGLLSALGWFGLAVSHENFWLVVVITTLLIVPTGAIILALVPQIVIQAVPEERTSESTGLSQVVRAFAKAIGTQIIAPEGGSYPAESAYVAAFCISGALSLICVFFLAMLPKNVRGISSERHADPSTGLG